jgi:hypothetical protein
LQDRRGPTAEVRKARAGFVLEGLKYGYRLLIEHDDLDLYKGVDARASAFASNAGLLEPTKAETEIAT